MLFDTHCHLNIESLQKNLENIISDARGVGVEKILIPGVTIESSRSAIEIAESHEDIWVGVGIHPTDTKETLNIKSQISNIENLILNSKVVAVGEIGLDYHVHDKNAGVRSEIEKGYQKELFLEQLKLASKYKKSVIIHSRESSEDMLQILRDNWDPFFSQKMVFHCCEPNHKILEFAIEKRIFIGIDGDLTYKKDKYDFVKNIPLDLIVLETDAPFLVPEPLRSKKIFPNEPKNIPIIIEYLSNILSYDKESLETQIWNNSNRLFLDKV